ncbi:PKD domain-containing protein [Desulfococcaceae bacterium HSG8]|nr:PKD domain-containing protein [Desulfococcaceae bacterium HSG8]
MRSVLWNIDGVLSVNVDTEELTADVTFDDEKTSVEQIKTALADGGYPVSEVVYENEPPVADAGPDQDVYVGDQVTLDASASHDPDDGIASYQWIQLSGETVILSDPGDIQPAFTAPDVPPEGDILSFFLTVTDNEGKASSDTCTVSVTPQSRVTRLTAQEAKDMIDTDPELLIVDVREEEEVCGEYGHIPGSLNYPWNTGVLQEKYEELPKDAGILVICRTGNRSEKAAEFLDSKGFTDVYDIGGMNTWEWEIMTCSGQPPELTVSVSPDQTVSLSWTEYTGMNFASYALLRTRFSDTDSPEDAYILDESDPAITDYNDESPLPGASYYKVCVLKTEGDELCSESVRADMAEPLTLSVSASITEGNAPLEVSFTVTAGGGISPYTYDWDFADGSSGNEENPIHIYSESGIYTASITLTDAEGDTADGSVTITVTSEPLPPVADAGPDQTADENTTVVLDASGSYDPDGEIQTYLWEQTGGTSVSLSDSSAPQPAFIGPNIGTEGESLTFQVTVTDGAGLQSSDTCAVYITGISNPPMADAGQDQTADEGTVVTLDASGSYDPDGEILTYLWEQGSGTSVTLSDPSSVMPEFTAPDVGQQGEALIFWVTVTDNDGLSSSGNSVIHINGINQAPAADAGADQTVEEARTIFLDASGSYDPDGDALTYSWEQAEGTPVSLSDPSATQPEFVSPDTGSQGESLTFSLTVTDGAGLQSSDTCMIYVTGISNPPVADAGADQTVEEGVTVVLDASGAYDPDGEIVTYLWEQTEGAAVSLSDQSASVPEFTAPDVATGGESLVFRLTVTDNDGLQSDDTCIVNVSDVNQPPAANAGADQTVDKGVAVTLDGSGSYDPEGKALVYSWEQTGGTLVNLSDPSAPAPGFTAPDIGSQGESLGFRLTVTDAEGLQSSDTCAVYITGENNPPSADAGADQTAEEGKTVSLDASGSYDPDGEILSFAWEQTEGSEVNLSDPSASQPSFTAPEVSPNGETLTFRVTVTDNDGLQSSDTCAVYITGENNPPSADAGADQTDEEGKTVSLDASGSYDPDGEILSFAWEQTEGSEVNLSDPSASQPSFTVPEVSPNGETLTFRVTVTDNDGLQSSDICVVNITSVNRPPVADAGADQSAGEGVAVTLDASASYDSDGDLFVYLWEQTEGDEVTLSDPSAPQPEFTSPNVGSGEVSLTFRVTVTDEAGLESSDMCTVYVAGIVRGPVADAGADQTVDEKKAVTLDGSASSAPDDTSLTYLWEQTSGTSVTLSDIAAVQPTFTAPSADDAYLEFQLTVSDSDGNQSTDMVRIKIEDSDSGGSGGCFIDTAGSRGSGMDFLILIALTLILFFAAALAQKRHLSVNVKGTPNK